MEVERSCVIKPASVLVGTWTTAARHPPLGWPHTGPNTWILCPDLCLHRSLVFLLSPTRSRASQLDCGFGLDLHVCAPIAYSAGFGKSTELLWSHPGFNFHVCAKDRSKDGIHRSQQVKLGVTGLGSKESQDVWEFLKWLWPQGTRTKATEKPVSLWCKISSQQLQKQAVG